MRANPKKWHLGPKMLLLVSVVDLALGAPQQRQLGSCTPRLDNPQGSRPCAWLQQGSFGCVCEHAGDLPRAQFVHVQVYGVPAILQPSNPWFFVALQHQTPMSCVLEVASRLSQTPGTTRSFLFAKVWCSIKSCEIRGA